MPLAVRTEMLQRVVRIIWVVMAVGVATQGCFLSKKRTGPGTNIGSGLGTDDDSPPAGIPAAR